MMIQIGLIPIIVIVLVPLIVYTFVTYNSLTSLRNLVKEAFSTMDVYLKKRWDLVPNLVETVKVYADYEKDTLEEIVNIRSGVYDNMETKEKVDVNGKLALNIRKLIALRESYPELKANESFNNLSEELSKIEADIANSRKYYNGAVRKLNDKIMMFPSNIVAVVFGFKPETMFEADEKEKNNVKVEL